MRPNLRARSGMCGLQLQGMSLRGKSVDSAYVMHSVMVASTSAMLSGKIDLGMHNAHMAC
jgi:hypothetical protein